MKILMEFETLCIRIFTEYYIVEDYESVLLSKVSLVP